MLFALKSPHLLYAFRYFDPVRRRWIRARVVAELHEIAARYARWEITVPPEIRLTDGTVPPARVVKLLAKSFCARVRQFSDARECPVLIN